MEVVFATQTGAPAIADTRMITGKGLGIWSPLLKADPAGQKAYQEMILCSAYRAPQRWHEMKSSDFDGIVLPGGHAPGMKTYLESEVLQTIIADFFSEQKIIGAICHGVVLVARSKRADGKSVLSGFQSTALLKTQEITAWLMTCLWLKYYYRTYAETVQAEVTRHLAASSDFITGPLPLMRDSSDNLKPGFVVEDRNYISARWPGDAHLFGMTLVHHLKNPRN